MIKILVKEGKNHAGAAKCTKQILMRFLKKAEIGPTDSRRYIAGR